MKHSSYLCEVEVTAGLEFVTEGELQKIGAQIVRTGVGEIDFRYSGDLRALVDLKTVQAVSLVQVFPVPRPRALLSNEYFPLILRQIETVRGLSRRDAYNTFFVAAAGSETAIMMRLKSLLAEKTGLAPDDEKGDLWIRIRPGRAGQGGWETVVRLTPRPSVTRRWRVCNLEGALNAGTAQAMIQLTRPQPTDTFVNFGCGSGTLLIERLAWGSCRRAIGIDIAAPHLSCASANIEASDNSSVIRLMEGDMTELPLRSASVDAACADLPFGQLSGTHAENTRLYPRLLAELARVLRIGARFVVITHEVRLMDRVLAQGESWSVERTVRVNLRGLHPRIDVLMRR